MKNIIKMKAVIAESYGGPGVLSIKEVEKPSPKPNEILIKIKSSTVTAADTMMRTGKPYIGRLMIGLTKPKNPISGTDFAGEVVGLGKDVTQFTIGEPVFGESIFGPGANAEYICVAEDGIIAKIPANKTYDEVAPMPGGGITSLNLLRDVAGIRAGQNILIIGASGSLGTYAVQIAKAYGAKVTGVCSTANLDLVKSLGADEVIDYTTTDFAENGEQYDIIYDTVGVSSFDASKASLTDTGTYLTPVMKLSLLCPMIKTALFGSKKVKFAATGTRAVPELRTLLQELQVMLAEGKLQTVIDRAFPMAQIHEAHQYVDKGHKKGNVILSIN